MPWQITFVRLLTRMLMGGGRVIEEGTRDKGELRIQNSEFRSQNSPHPVPLPCVQGRGGNASIAAADDGYLDDGAALGVGEATEGGDGFVAGADGGGEFLPEIGGEDDPFGPLVVGGVGEIGVFFGANRAALVIGQRIFAVIGSDHNVPLG